MAEHQEKNRAHWDGIASEYQEQHAGTLAGAAWGVWQIPEEELNALGDVAGKDMLEFGAGAAQWSIAMAKRGARPVALDLSPKQLDQARRLMDEAGVDFPLVEASAEHVPLPDASFDVVFCDHGAMMWADPYRTVPEASRLLRPGGLLAFTLASPLLELCWDHEKDELTDQLRNDYFGLHRLEDDEGVIFNLPFGEWIRLFAEHDLQVESLIDIQAPEGATTTYEGWRYDWARRWPAEHIWRVRKR